MNLVLALEADEDAQWKATRLKVRNQVRKADRECLYLATGSSAELLDGSPQEIAEELVRRIREHTGII